LTFAMRSLPLPRDRGDLVSSFQSSRRDPSLPARRCPGGERVMGIEPTLPAWKAGTLPLSYTRNGPRAPERGDTAGAVRVRVKGAAGAAALPGCLVGLLWRCVRSAGPYPSCRSGASGSAWDRACLGSPPGSAGGVRPSRPFPFGPGGAMGGAGFEPAKALPPDLQSGPFGRLGIHPVNGPRPRDRHAPFNGPGRQSWR
jgi:hypothetical protein